MTIDPLKASLIKSGLYKPARWLVDHAIDRSRLRDRRARATLIRKLVPAESLCFDIGANVGDYAAMLLDAGMRVVSIDAQPASIDELRARFSNDRRITIVSGAVGEQEGSADFYISEQHATSGMLQEWEGEKRHNKIVVPVTTLDKLIAIHGVPAYIKMDIEGYEATALRGLHRQIDLISVEYHLNDNDCAAKLAIISYLRQFGSITANMLPEGSDKFQWSEFVSPEVFAEGLKRQLQSAKDKHLYAYGDIFIRTS